jgi:Cys-tRNA(Pro) deacylase
MEQAVPPAVERLAQLGIPFRVFQHERPPQSLEQAAAERDQKPEQIIRSLLFRVTADTYLMVLMPGPGQVPWKSLRRHMQVSRLTMATEEEVYQVTGCRPGTVNPFSMRQPVKVLVERTILQLPEVSFGSCERGTAILITPENLLRVLDDYEIVDFSD